MPDARLGIVAIEQDSPDGCMAAARSILSIHPRVDVLVNNACPAMATTTDTSQNAGDASWTDVTGLYAFTAAIMPGLLASQRPRIVTVVPAGTTSSSSSSPDAMTDSAMQSRASAALDQPLSVTEFTRELNSRLVLEGSRVQSMVAEPATAGMAHEHTLDNLDPNGPLGRPYAHQLADRVASPQLQAATDPRARGGDLYVPTFCPGGQPMRLRMTTSSLETRIRWNVVANAVGIRLTTRRYQLLADGSFAVRDSAHVATRRSPSNRRRAQHDAPADTPDDASPGACSPVGHCLVTHGCLFQGRHVDVDTQPGT